MSVGRKPVRRGAATGGETADASRREVGAVGAAAGAPVANAAGAAPAPAAAAPAAPAAAEPSPLARPVSIKHVAQAAGVSLKTVSRVINDDPVVRPEMRERVRQAIAALNYQSDPLARSLRSAHSFALGLVYDNPNAHYVVSLQSGVLSACRERGYALQIHPCRADAPALAEELVALAQRSRLAGLLLAPPMSERRELVAALAAHGVCVMRIISASADPQDAFDCVQVDDRHAARAIVEHLVQLGHSRIAFLWGDADHDSSLQRYAGYADALQDYGIAIDPARVLAGDYSFNSGFRGARKLLALAAPPTAVFGSNDEIAAGVLAAARSVGLDVPGDLAIAGFEDSPFSRLTWPLLTTARQDTVAIARAAALRLIERVRHVQLGQAVSVAAESFVPELVVRASTAAPRRAPGREPQPPVHVFKPI